MLAALFAVMDSGSDAWSDGGTSSGSASTWVIVVFWTVVIVGACVWFSRSQK